MNYPSEIDLLLCCTHAHVDTQKDERVKQLIQSDLDWNYLIEIAQRKKIASLLYWNLQRICPQSIPSTSLEKLQQSFQENQSHNQLLIQELLNLLNLFKQHDLAALTFKGPVLTASAYGNLALRRFLDLDILFDKKDILKARDLIIAQGYKNAEQLTEQQEINQLESRYVKAYTYQHDERQVTVEIHWQLRATYTAFPFDYENLWNRLASISINDTEVASLVPEDELLYLCVHGCGDRWRTLLQICDLAEVIHAHPNLNWQKMLEQANKLGCQRRLFLGIFLAQELLGTNLPPEIKQKIQADSAVKWLAEWLYQRLFRPANEFANVFEQAVFDLVCLESLTDKFIYLGDRLILLMVKKLKLGFAKKYGLPGGK